MKLERKSLADSVYKALLRKIMDGSIKAGDKLREEHLCKSLGVSRTPLREGLLRLAKEGLIERKPNCGCVARERSCGEMSELMDCRSMLEGLAVERHFNALNWEKLNALKCRLESAKALPPEKARRDILDADEALHKLILDACENRFLKEQIEHLQNLCAPYRIFRCESAPDIESIARERLEIVEAMLNRDRESAVSKLEDHFAKSVAAFKNQKP